MGQGWWFKKNRGWDSYDNSRGCRGKGIPVPGEGRTLFVGQKLYFAYIYAKFSGDWDFVRRHWTEMKQVLRYVETVNDWAWMNLSAEDDRLGYGGDVSLCGLVGTAGYLQMAKVLGDEEEADKATYLLARLAVLELHKWDLVQWWDRFSPEGEGSHVPLIHASYGHPRLLSVPKQHKEMLQAYVWPTLSLTYQCVSPEQMHYLKWPGGDEFWSRFYRNIESMADWVEATRHVSYIWRGVAALKLWTHDISEAGPQLERFWEVMHGWPEYLQYEIITGSGAIWNKWLAGEAPYLSDWGEAKMEDLVWSGQNGKLLAELDYPEAVKATFGGPLSPEEAQVDGTRTEIIPKGRGLWEVAVPGGRHQVDILFQQ